MRICEKLSAALRKRRVSAYTIHPGNGMAAKIPGSQNRKKGCSAKQR